MPSAPRRIIGYYAGWTAKTKNFTPADIPADKLTHVNYAFGLIDEHGRAMLQDAEADIGHADVAANPDPGSLEGNFHQLRLLKERHPHLQTLISMGGWTGSGRFSDAVATEEKRRAFVASCIELFLTRWPGVFDGIDIDWEYPVCCGLPENAYRPEDRRNCTLLFEELRRQLDALGAATGQRYLLTAAIPAGREIPVTSFELREAGQILDWINVMTYDMTGSQRSSVTNFNAPFAESSGDPSDLDWKRFSSVVGTIGSFLDEGGAARQARRRRPVLRTRVHRRSRGPTMASISRSPIRSAPTTTPSRRTTCRCISDSAIPKPRCPGSTTPPVARCSPTMIPSRSAARPTTSWPRSWRRHVLGTVGRRQGVEPADRDLVAAEGPQKSPLPV